MFLMCLNSFANPIHSRTNLIADLPQCGIRPTHYLNQPHFQMYVVYCIISFVSFVYAVKNISIYTRKT